MPYEVALEAIEGHSAEPIFQLDHLRSPLPDDGVSLAEAWLRLTASHPSLKEFGLMPSTAKGRIVEPHRYLYSARWEHPSPVTAPRRDASTWILRDVPLRGQRVSPFVDRFNNSIRKYLFLHSVYELLTALKARRLVARGYPAEDVTASEPMLIPSRYWADILQIDTGSNQISLYDSSAPHKWKLLFTQVRVYEGLSGIKMRPAVKKPPGRGSKKNEIDGAYEHLKETGELYEFGTLKAAALRVQEIIIKLFNPTDLKGISTKTIETRISKRFREVKRADKLTPKLKSF